MFFLAVYVKEGLPFVLDSNCTRGVTGEKEIWSITNDYFTEITIHLNLLLRIMRIKRIRGFRGLSHLTSTKVKCTRKTPTLTISS